MMRLMVAVIVSMTVMPFSIGCADNDPEAEAPQVSLDVRSEERYTAGEDIVRITVTASDPQDQALTFEAIDVPDRSDFQTFQNQAVFTWDPIISDVTDDEPHRLVFAATNEAGLTTERTVSVYIDAGQLGTRFLNSSSQLYDPSSGEPLSFDVRVRNEQVGLVILSMAADEQPEGATFEQTDDFEGRFEWMPSPAQREKRIHKVRFEADDEDEVVEQQVTIILQDPNAGPTTPSEDPTPGMCDDDTAIAHTPLGAQRTADAYRIEGEITDTSRNWVEAVLYWTIDDPLGASPDYESEVLELDGNSFDGAIPNPLVSSGDSADVSYTICAFDDTDDDEGVACAPDEFLYRFVAYSPGNQECIDDGIDLSDPGSADAISTTVWEPYRVCDDASKFHNLKLEDGEVVEVMVSYSPETTPTIELSMDGDEVDLDVVPCIGLAYATLEGPGQALLEVRDADFPYHVTGFRDAAECPDSEYEPNDTHDQATLIVDDMTLYEDMAICSVDDRDVFTMELTRGDYIDALLEFEHTQGDLDMTLFAPSQTGEIIDGGYGVAQGWSTDDDESFLYVAEESGFYNLSVVSVDEPNDYDLVVERACDDDDDFTGNDNNLDAALIEVGEETGLKICENESDWYRLDYDGDGEGLFYGAVEVEYGSASAVEVVVYEVDGGLVEEGTAFGDRIDFVLEPDSPTSYEIEVWSNRPTLYDLSIEDLGL